jgi:hypothetical protein
MIIWLVRYIILVDLSDNFPQACTREMCKHVPVQAHVIYSYDSAECYGHYQNNPCLVPPTLFPWGSDRGNSNNYILHERTKWKRNYSKNNYTNYTKCFIRREISLDDKRIICINDFTVNAPRRNWCRNSMREADKME